MSAAYASGPSCCGQSGCSTCCDTSSCNIVSCNTNNSTCCDSNDDCCCKDVFCKSHFSPRSQGMDTARWLVGKQRPTHSFDTDELYGDFSITAAFTRSFKTEKIGKYFVPSVITTADSCCTTCNTCCNNSSSTACNSTCSSCSSNCDSGSSCCTCNCFTLGPDAYELTTAEEATVHARAEDFGVNCTGTACLYPRISNFIIDFDLYVGLNEHIKGLFVEIHAPVVHTWWDPNCCVCEEAACTDSFDTYLMSDDATKNSVGTTSVKRALKGNFVWGDLAPESTLNYAQICSGRQTRTRLADLRFGIGYNAIENDKYRLGLKVMAAAPTGNVPLGTYMFEPIVGNGGHWELGGGISAHAIFWDKDEDNQFSWHLEGYLAHMFKSRCHKRTFDLQDNGCFSRYLLLKKYQKALTSGGKYQLEAYGLERGPNVFTHNVKVSVDVQGDVSTMFSYRHKNWTVDLGYNFWGRSRETLEEFYCCIPENRYGIKGTTPMSDGTDEDITTASLSTMKESDGLEGVDDGTDPVFITCQDFNCCSALHPSALSHAVFFHLNASWENEDDINPFFGIGGKVEWSGRGNRALDQWSIWAKGGISF